MVRIKNDIESSSGSFIAAAPVKDVNLKRQEAKQSRRRSYRCVTIVATIILVLMGLGVGSVLYFGKSLNRIPTKSKDGMPSTSTTSTTSTTTTTTAQPVEPSTLPPTFADPYDDDEPEKTIVPTDDDEFDIDGPVVIRVSSTNDISTIVGTVVTTSRSRLISDEGSGSGEYYDEDGSGDW